MVHGRALSFQVPRKQNGAQQMKVDTFVAMIWTTVESSVSLPRENNRLGISAGSRQNTVHENQTRASINVSGLESQCTTI